MAQQDSENNNEQLQDENNTQNTARMLGRGLNTTARTAAKGVRGTYRGVAKVFSSMRKIGFVLSFIGVFLFIFLVVGALSFIINMPGMVLDKLKIEANNYWDAVYGYINKNINGMDLPGDKEIKDLAIYLSEEMGYDLIYYGFATEYEYDRTNKKVDKLTTKYIPLYLAAEEKSYLVANQTESWSFSSMWKGIKDIIGGAKWADISFGTGALHITNHAMDLLKITVESEGADKSKIENKVKSYRREKELIISRVPMAIDDYVATTSNVGIEGYRFKLKYWLEKYTTPLNFYISLHIATRAPEFVAQIATNPSLDDGIKGDDGKILDTRIDIDIKELTPGRDVKTELVYLDIDPVKKKIKIDPNTNLPVMLTIDEIRARLKAGQKVYGFTGDEKTDNNLLNKAANFSEENLTAYTPYIQKVINHWFYKEIIYQGTSRSGAYNGEVDVYKMEDLEKPIIRYQRYQAIQTPEVNTPNDDGTGTDIPASGETQWKIWCALRKLGYSEYTVAGVLGNVQRESNFNATAFNSQGGGKGAYGLAQWRADRQTGLENYAKSKGKDKSDVDTQIEYLIGEITGGGAAKGYAKQQNGGRMTEFAKWGAADSAKSAAVYFMNWFERPGDSSTEREIRGKYAEQWYNRYHGKDINATNTLGSTTSSNGNNNTNGSASSSTGTSGGSSNTNGSASSSTGTSSGNSSTGGSASSSTGTSSGSSSSSGSSQSGQEITEENTENQSTFTEKSTGYDRKEIEEMTKDVESSGIGEGGFWNSLLKIISSGNWLGNLNGITGMISDLPKNIITNSFSELSKLINSYIPSSLIGNISTSWLGKLNNYALNGVNLNLSNIGQYLDVSKITNEMGISNLSNLLTSNGLIKELGLDKVTSGLSDLGQVTDLNKLSTIATNSISNNTSSLSTAFSNVTSMISKGTINTSGIVDALYNGASEVLRSSDVTQYILQGTRGCFSGVRDGSASQIASGLITGLATDIVNRTTNDVFNTIKTGIQNNLNLSGIFNVQIEKLLQNENSKILTGLTIDELEKVAGISNLNFNDVVRLNSELVQIKEKVDNSTVSLRELSSIVNQIAKDYAGVDAITLYYVGKSIEEAIGSDDGMILGALKEVENAIQSIERAIADGMVIENKNRLEALINDVNQLIEKIKALIYSLNMEDEGTYRYVDNGHRNTITLKLIRVYARQLADMGETIQVNIEDNTSGTAKSILGSLAELAKSKLEEAGDIVEKIDVNTIIKYKKIHPEATLTDLKKLIDELIVIDPSLNGMTNDITKLGDKLEDINEENTNKIVINLNNYNANVDKISWLTSSEKTKLKTQASNVKNNVSNTTDYILRNSSLGLINNLASRITGITTSKINTLANQIINLPNNTINKLLDTAKQIPQELIKKISEEFNSKVADAVVNRTKEDLTEKVTKSMKGSLDGNGQLTETIKQGNSGGRGEALMVENEEPSVGTENEFLTGFYIKETRIRDYIQKSEPILVPYGLEHWTKAFITNKYLIAGTDTYQELKMKYPEKNLFEDDAIVQKYGQSLWNASNGTLEEAIYAELSSSESVDSQYLIRYFKELFNLYGDSLRAVAETENQKLKSENDNTKHTIGWIFDTKEVEEIVNTNQNVTRKVLKSDYEPVSWTASNAGILYSKDNQAVYGFEKNINIVSPADAVVISKTDKKKNEIGDEVTASVTLQIKSSDQDINGMRVIIKGGDFSQTSEGATVTKNTVIGETTEDNIIILVLEKGSHAQVADVSKYVYPPYVTINEGVGTQSTTTQSTK